MIEKSIAVIGSTSIDQIILKNRCPFKSGGVTIYAGITYSRHGIKTMAITNIADRNPQVMACLRNQRILLHNGQTRQTTRFINDIHTGSRRQKNPQRAAPISRQQILDHVKDVDGVHLGPLHPKDIDIDGIKSLKGLHREVILDVQGLVRGIKNANVYPAVSPHIDAALSVSDIVKANKYEYEMLIQFFQMDLAELMRRFEIREFIVTDGAGGGFVQPPDEAAIPYAAAAIESGDDTTGAGDIFLAAYVVEHLWKQRPILDACEYAARLVARQIEGTFIKAEDLHINTPLAV